MSDILFIKTSSLGDVIHHMPAVTEARGRRREAHVSWVVEEGFAPLVRLHPAVDEVIPIATRRWRGAAFTPRTWQEVAGFVDGLRKHDYHEIIDSQGLFFKSALIARLARGRRHGYDATSIRERAACLLYDVRHRVDRGLHAIARNRMLTGLALGYAPEGAIDFGLERETLANPAGSHGILLHATARPHKEWPEASWIALGQALEARRGAGKVPVTVPLMLPWGTPTERLRSGRIAAAIAGAIVPDGQPLDILARYIAGASFVIGVDTGLLHLAAALGVPLVGIFTGSEPGLTGPMGGGPIAIVGGKGAIPSVAEVMSALDRLS
jgi:lipopolysaccharide heptosyltransferase I